MARNTKIKQIHNDNSAEIKGAMPKVPMHQNH